MGTVNWTEQQLAAITARNPGILVSAGAGSGKTAVLTERVVQRIFDETDPVDADRMLIVTYTRAAAEEMRERIAAKLRAVQQARPEDHSVARQLILLQKADISTVHSFCQRLVKENFQQLGVESGFRIADEKELDIWRREAAAEIIEEEYAAGEESFTELVELLAEERSDRRVIETVLRLYDFVRAHPFYHCWMEEKLELYSGSAPLAETPWGRNLWQQAARRGEAARQSLGQALELLQGDEKLAKAYGENLHYLHRAADTLTRSLAEGNWDAARGAVAGLAPPRFGALRGYEDEEKKARVTALRDRGKKILEEIAGELVVCTESEFQEDRRALYPVVARLFDITRRFDEYFSRRKRDQNALDFSDLEHLAIRLLAEPLPGGGYRPTSKAEELSRHYRQVFVDEYQDTNAVQDMIFTCVSDQGRALFMVGDVKQSIYRFRQANPEIFLRKKRSFSPYAPGKTGPVSIDLSRNFRSRREVTDGINYLFEQVMSREVGDIDYREGEQLVPGADYPELRSAGCEIHLLRREDSQRTAREQEAEYIAGLVEEMIRSGSLVTARDGGLRPVRPGDICILLRSMKDKSELYRQALENRGIGSVGDTAGGFLHSREVSAVTALLRAIDNPLLDVSLAAAMLSPIFAFTPDEMAEIRLEGRGRSLYSCVVLHAAKSEKTAAFLRLMQQFRGLSASQSVDRLITSIYDSTGFEAVARAMDGGEKRLQNLRLLPEYAADYGARGYGGLSAFVRLLDRLEESGSDLAEGSVTATGEDTVRIMSIHKSKGLEFPVVILADCAKNFNTMDLSASVLLHTELGFACRRRDRERRLEFGTLPLAAVRAQLEAELRSEELRMLYVALTRAKERLILVGTPRGELSRYIAGLYAPLEDGRVPGETAGAASSYLDWTVAALLHHPDGEPLRLEAEIYTGSDAPPKGSEFRITLADPVPGPENTEREAAGPIRPDPELTARFREAMEYRYPHQEAVGISSKFAISHLAEEMGVTEKRRFTARPAFLYKQGLTPAERGNAVHTFMQFCDYPAAARDPAAEVERLVRERFITPEEGESIDTERIAAFFSSSLYGRIARADRVWREYRFLAVIGEEELHGLAEAELHGCRTTVQGVADCIFQEGDCAVVLDYKTDRVASPDELAERYRVQLGLYGRLLSRALGMPVTRCVIWSFHLGREVEINFQ
ncbi:MAG: helicase-exonuclease AddAB subunit AddA [Clostridiales bacterium]|nr:helicase-exonuclease AddAB subunit AddA [Clostridiales bacterium]